MRFFHTVPAHLRRRAGHTHSGRQPDRRRAYVEGGTTPEGKPWQIWAVRTDLDRGWATVLVTLPSPLFVGGQSSRTEYSPISEGWTGELAELRGTVQWGVEGQEAAVACLGPLSSGTG